MHRVLYSLAIILCLIAPAILKAEATTASKAGDEFVVVIDPGHGGHDSGALGLITNEKSINLAVALLVRDILGDDAPEISVIMTRDDDTFVTLQGRAAIANKAGGDLFVSIHANSLDRKNPRHKTVAGASVYSLGVDRSEENLAVAMRENAVMTLEDDYTTTYEGFDPNSAESYIIFEMDRDLHMDQSISAASAIQSELVATASRQDRGVRQAGFLVLRATSMPAVLVELDFICNPTQEKYMASDAGRRALARAIANGICQYRDEALRARVNAGTASPSRRPSSPRKKAKPAPTTSSSSPRAEELREEDGARFFRIQFLTAPRLLPDSDSRLANLPAEPLNFYRHGGMVKYTIGRFATEAEATDALKAVRRRFPDAFVITTLGSQRE